eukprot:scaffold234644_cov23-Tisochrysis_lutea.AAC.1
MFPRRHAPYKDPHRRDEEHHQAASTRARSPHPDQALPGRPGWVGCGGAELTQASSTATAP